MTLTTEQLELRRQGITATDISAIMGANPYRRPIDVYLDKTGASKPFMGNERTRWGNMLEPLIRDDYATRRNVTITVPGTLVHPEYGWAMATPDGICYQHTMSRPSHGLEIKTHSLRLSHLYGEPGSDEVPMYELLQCAWNMHITGLGVWDLVVFMDNRPMDYRITRDDELIAMCHEAAQRFLVDNVKACKHPEPDGSDRYAQWLSTMYPQDRQPAILIDGNEDALREVRSLRATRAAIADAEGKAEVLTQQIKLRCGDAGGIEWTEDDGKRERITYRASKSTTRTDWEGAFSELVARATSLIVESRGPDGVTKDLQACADDAIKNHSKSTQGSRRFVVPRSWNNGIKES